MKRITASLGLSHLAFLRQFLPATLLRYAQMLRLAELPQRQGDGRRCE
ncbi:MAG: hypothetical protein Q4F00_13130 [bacterium]|nr:hypothetical protein [bacterium]